MIAVPPIKPIIFVLSLLNVKEENPITPRANITIKGSSTIEWPEAILIPEQ
jgi:hypothetical protein